MKERLLLRPTEAADQLGVSRSTIYEEIRSGRIESVRIGASRRVPWDALVAYIDRIRKGGGDSDPTQQPPVMEHGGQPRD